MLADKSDTHQSQTQPQFKWFGLVVLLVGVEGVLFLINYPVGLLCLTVVLPVYLLLMLLLVRYLDWKNGLLAALLFCTFHPIRFIFHWWVNPILYGLVALLCLALTIRFVRQYSWKNSVAVVMVVCLALAVVQTIVSASEIGECYVDNVRYSRYVYRNPSGAGYQQIGSLPIGMQGYCYYCPWY